VGEHKGALHYSLYCTYNIWSRVALAVGLNFLPNPPRSLDVVPSLILVTPSLFTPVNPPRSPLDLYRAMEVSFIHLRFPPATLPPPVDEDPNSAKAPLTELMMSTPEEPAEDDEAAAAAKEAAVARAPGESLEFTSRIW